MIVFSFAITFPFVHGLASTAFGQCREPTFFRTAEFQVVREPTAVAVGDFNNDGLKDIVVSSYYDANVGVQLRQPNGDFGPIRLTNVQVGPSSIAVGLFDQDSFLDLAVTNYISDTVTILRGTGTGSFVLKEHISTGSRSDPIFVTARDLNKDNNVDLVIANFSSNELLILKGDGAANFPAANRIRIPTREHPRHFTFGLFDVGEEADLAVVHDSSPAIFILLANRTGGFDMLPRGFNAGFKPGFVATNDFNFDGRLDLAVSNMMGSNISILSGNGDGTFSSPANFRAGQGPTDLGLGDFTRDERQDVAVTNMRSNNVSILAGNGRGVFVTNSPFPVAERPIAVAADDFNADLRPDLLVISRKPNGFGAAGNGVLMINTCGVPNLVLSTTPGSALSFTVGRTQYYSFNVMNKGSGRTSGPITLTDQLPTGLTFREATGTGWTCSAASRTVTCRTSELISPGANSVLTMTVDVAQTAVPTAVNTAAVFYSGEVIRDDNDVRVETAVLPSSDLRVEYDSFSATVLVEQNIVYVVTATNTGPSPAADVVLADLLPASLEFVSATSTIGTCTGTPHVRCNVGNMAINATVRITITARAKEVGVVDNSVVVRGGNVDLNSSNNSQTATTQITQRPPSR